ncbi:hypothetical protein HY967_04895 [Candidatus Jorgensenbacteria bacterium]|nr:hypothetical protein [Candidatus Jorgensenbacteria bacterium]
MIHVFFETAPTWILWVVSMFSVIGYFALGLVGWYLSAGFKYGLSGGQLGRHPLLFPFQCFLEELPCYLPGGVKYRIEFIKSRVGGPGTMLSSKKSYSHEEIRQKNLYEEVFWVMCGGRFSFWAEHISYVVFWPVIFAYIILLGGIPLLFVGVGWIFSRVRKIA